LHFYRHALFNKVLKIHFIPENLVCRIYIRGFFAASKKSRRKRRSRMTQMVVAQKNGEIFGCKNHAKDWRERHTYM